MRKRTKFDVADDKTGEKTSTTFEFTYDIDGDEMTEDKLPHSDHNGNSGMELENINGNNSSTENLLPAGDVSQGRELYSDIRETNVDGYVCADEHHVVKETAMHGMGLKEGAQGTKAEVYESSFHITVQIFFPFIIAGLGTVAAGLMLDKVQHYEVFEKISEVFILVPALLGLKGNLEMTLASRLSTQANLGNMDSKKELFKMVSGNIVLTQAQAVIVGFLASISAMVMGWIPQGKFNIGHGMLLCASSVVTASIASLILGCVMVIVVLLSRRFHINPDNVATPIAASLGDITTLCILASISSFLFHTIEHHKWVAPVIISIFLLLTPLWFYLSATNSYTNDVIYSGWTPVIAAMVISSIGGLILDMTVTRFIGLAVFQPVINGVGGNLVAVQASRLSTSLHMRSKLGELMPDATHGCPNPIRPFCGCNNNSRAARVLLALVIPGQLIFVSIIALLNAGHTQHSVKFFSLYLSAAMIQVILLLYLADWLVHFLWLHKSDPDNSAIPYLTALGDLLGTAFLAIAFVILHQTSEAGIIENTASTPLL